MTVKDLEDNVCIYSYDFSFKNPFDVCNVLCDASKTIKTIVEESLKNGILNRDDILRDKVEIEYRLNFIKQLREKYDDIDTDILYSKLVVDSIYDSYGKLMLAVHYEE